MPRKRPYISPEQRRKIRVSRAVQASKAAMMRARLEALKTSLKTPS